MVSKHQKLRNFFSCLNKKFLKKSEQNGRNFVHLSKKKNLFFDAKKLLPISRQTETFITKNQLKKQQLIYRGLCYTCILWSVILSLVTFFLLLNDSTCKVSFIQVLACLTAVQFIFFVIFFSFACEFREIFFFHINSFFRVSFFGSVRCFFEEAYEK